MQEILFWFLALHISQTMKLGFKQLITCSSCTYPAVYHRLHKNITLLFPILWKFHVSTTAGGSFLVLMTVFPRLWNWFSKQIVRHQQWWVCQKLTKTAPSWVEGFWDNSFSSCTVAVVLVRSIIHLCFHLLHSNLVCKPFYACTKCRTFFLTVFLISDSYFWKLPWILEFYINWWRRDTKNSHHGQ